eukprot:2800041-Pleurochrysis_carterae.AAC.1
MSTHSSSRTLSLCYFFLISPSVHAVYFARANLCQTFSISACTELFQALSVKIDLYVFAHARVRAGALLRAGALVHAGALVRVKVRARASACGRDPCNFYDSWLSGLAS